MPELRFVDACTEAHFAAMSAIHCRGWRAAYPGYVPDDYLKEVVTEERWVPFFREDYATKRCKGLLLLRDLQCRLRLSISRFSPFFFLYLQT